MKAYSVNCFHVYDIRPGGKSYGHAVVETEHTKIKIDRCWKFCPVCGEEIMFDGVKEGSGK